MNENNMMLAVSVNNGIINTNFEELELVLKEKMKTYKMMVYTGEDALADMKKDRKELNTLIKQMDTRRKEVKEAYTKPLTEFEDGVKRLVSIVKETVTELDSSVKEIEDNARKERKKNIRDYFEKIALEKDFLADPFSEVLYSRVYDERWENKTTTQKKWKTEILTAINDYLKNLEMLKAMNEPEFYERAIEKYQASLDIKDALEYIMEKQRLRAEEEAARIRREAELEAARIKAEAEVKAKAEAEIQRAKEEAQRTAAAEIEKAKKETEEERERIRKEEEAKAEAKIAEALEKAKQNPVNRTQNVADIINPACLSPDAPSHDADDFSVNHNVSPHSFFGVPSTDQTVQDASSWEPVTGYNPFDDMDKPVSMDGDSKNPFHDTSDNLFSDVPKMNSAGMMFGQGYVSPEYEQATFDFDTPMRTFRIYEKDSEKVKRILAQNNVYYEF